MTDEEYAKLSVSEKKQEDWMNSKWRPMCAWMYMLVCTMDMVVFPILWSLLQSLNHGQVTSQWQPLTLQGAGLFHIAMGAVLGIAAFGRTQEKLSGANNGGMQFQQGAGTTYIPPGQVNVGVSNQSPAGGFGGNNYGGTSTSTTGFQSGAPAFGQPQSGSRGNSGGFGSPAPSSFGSTGFGAGSNSTTLPGVETIYPTVVSGTPMVSKPVSNGPIDNGFMPPRE